MSLYARINLSETNYDVTLDMRYLIEPDTDKLEEIYDTYCKYKRFASVMPLFPEEYTYPQSDTWGYYHEDKLVAFSLMFRHNDKNVAALQFAWDYKNPKLRLGIKSLQCECAVYKNLGYDYLYLGDADEYKQNMDGFEICGPRY